MLKYRSLDNAFRALSDPARRAIIERLAIGPASVSDLAAPLPMSLPAVHQHLQVLARAGLMKWEKKGRVRWCHLSAERLESAENWIAQRRMIWERRLDALERHLTSDDKTIGGPKR